MYYNILKGCIFPSHDYYNRLFNLFVLLHYVNIIYRAIMLIFIFHLKCVLYITFYSYFAGILYWSFNNVEALNRISVLGLLSLNKVLCDT